MTNNHDLWAGILLPLDARISNEWHAFAALTLFTLVSLVSWSNAATTTEEKNINQLLGKLEELAGQGESMPAVETTINDIIGQREKVLAKLIVEAKNTEKNVRYRRVVMQILSKGKDQAGANALIENLGDKNPEIRTFAAICLENQNAEIVDESLLNSMEDNDSGVRRQVVHALGRHKNKKAVQKILKLTEDKDRFVAITSVWALGEIGENTTLDHLFEMCNSDDETITINIIAAMGKIGGTRAKEKLLALRQNANGMLIELIDDAIKKAEKR